MSILSRVDELITSSASGDIHYKKWNVDFRDQYFKDVYWSYFPITEKYFFEGNPTFLYEYRNLNDIARYPLVTVRDGFSGILDFFLNNPTPPEDFRTLLLVPKKFEGLIPKQWNEYVGSYNLKSKKERSHSSNEEIIIHGLGVEDLFWNEKFSKKIKELKNLVDDFSKTTFLIPQRESLLSDRSNQNKKYNLLLHKHLYENFGFDINTENDSEKFINNYKRSNFCFVNLDQNNGFVFDNYIDHYLWSKGGIKLEEEFRDEGEQLEYDLSPFHSICISDVNSDLCSFPEFYLTYRISGARRSSLYSVYQNEKFVNLFNKYYSN